MFKETRQQYYDRIKIPKDKKEMVEFVEKPFCVLIALCTIWDFFISFSIFAVTFAESWKMSDESSIILSTIFTIVIYTAAMQLVFNSDRTSVAVIARVMKVKMVNQALFITGAAIVVTASLELRVAQCLIFLLLFAFLRHLIYGNIIMVYPMARISYYIKSLDRPVDLLLSHSRLAAMILVVIATFVVPLFTGVSLVDIDYKIFVYLVTGVSLFTILGMMILSRFLPKFEVNIETINR